MAIALLGRSGSAWLADVASRCERACALLDLDAPLREGEVLIDDGRVLWQGFDLACADLVLLERPAFAWPQPGDGVGALSPGGEREARTLALSALFAAAETVAVIDPPGAAHLAVAPILALDLCARAGLAVHPWTLVAERPAEDGRTWLDPAGGDHWRSMGAPEPGEPAWGPEPFEGEALSVLWIGESAVGARRFAGIADLAAGEALELLPSGELPPGAAALAGEAARALSLSFLQVDLCAGPAGAAGPRIARVVPGVDPGPWNRELDGAAAAAAARLLEARTRIP